MTGQDLYEMLGLEKLATQADIKKAYYKLALQWHPDRNQAPEATAKFQALQRIYDILSDPAKRQVYDRTGSLQDCEDMVQSDNFQELYTAFREALKVTEEDIDSFAVTYRGSAEERADLLRLYQQHKGDMTKVFDWLMLSRLDMDSHRFRDTLEAAIAAGEVKRLKAYKPWAAQVAATPPPSTDPLAPPKKGATKDKGDGDDMALVAAIRNKGAAFSGMLAALEAKYGGKDSSKGSKPSKGKKGAAATTTAAAADGTGSKRKRSGKAAAAAAAAAGSSDGSSSGSDVESDADQGPEPTDAEFEAARARIMQRTQGTAGKAAGKAGKAGKQQQQQGKAAGKGKAATAAAAAAAAAGVAASAVSKKQRQRK